MPPRQHLPVRYAAVFDAYAAALAQAPLEEHTRRAYASRVRGFLTWLAGAAWPGADTPALFLNGRGGRLSDRSANLLLDENAPRR